MLNRSHDNIINHIYTLRISMYSLLEKLLEQDPEVMKLIAVDPFEGGGVKPKYIRVMKYKYRFGKNGEDYWVREPMGKVFPRQGLCSLEVLNELC
jgi:hypothetical protein